MTRSAHLGAVIRGALRLYLITAALMFVGGAVGGALLAMAGYVLPNPF